MTKLSITSKVLDKIGFSEYWDEHGTWGGRTLEFTNGIRFRIAEIDETEDDSEGYSSDGEYVSNHFFFTDWFAISEPSIKGHFDLFFIHEMYECIRKCYPDCVSEFEAILKKNKMYKYVDRYLKSVE